MTEGVRRISAERQRQIEGEGWTAEHDDDHGDGDLAWAAVCYTAPDLVFKAGRNDEEVVAFVDPWPWHCSEDARDYPEKHDRIDYLVKAGALIAAEIDRLIRKERKATKA